MLGKRKSFLPHVLVKGTEEENICAGMYKLTPECWIWSHGPQNCVDTFHRGRPGPVLKHRDENENEGEDKEVCPASCRLTMGCDDITHQANESQWFTFGPQVPSETPTTSGLPGSDRSSQHQLTATDHVEMLQECVGCCCEEQLIESNACVGVYGQREQDGLNLCWSGSPANYYVVRRNMVVEVEVVEEVAVEDTVEIMTENLYADGLLDVEFLQSEQLYPP